MKWITRSHIHVGIILIVSLELIPGALTGVAKVAISAMITDIGYAA
jgi:hypothetical protein